MSNTAFVVNPGTTDLDAASTSIATTLHTMGVADQVTVDRPSPSEVYVNTPEGGFSVFVGDWTPQGEEETDGYRALRPGAQPEWPAPAIELSHPHGGPWIQWIFARVHHALAADLGGVLADEGVGEVWVGDRGKYPTYESWLDGMFPKSMGPLGTAIKATLRRR